MATTWNYLLCNQYILLRSYYSPALTETFICISGHDTRKRKVIVDDLIWLQGSLSLSSRLSVRCFSFSINQLIKKVILHSPKKKRVILWEKMKSLFTNCSLYSTTSVETKYSINYIIIIIRSIYFVIIINYKIVLLPLEKKEKENIRTQKA